MARYPELESLDLDSLYKHLELAKAGMRRVLGPNKAIYRPRVKALEALIVEREADNG